MHPSSSSSFSSSSTGASLPVLLVCSLLTLALVAAELLLGHFSHCLTLLAVTNQSVYNLLTLVFAAIAKKLEGRDASLKTTFGWARVGVVGSLTSLAFLGSLSFATSIECLQTLAHSGHLDTMHEPFWVGVLAGCHVAVWLVVFCLAGGYTFQQCVVIGTSPAGDPSLRIPHSPSDCTSEGCQSETDDISVAFWRKMDRLVKVPFSYVFRDLAGCCLLLVVSLCVYLSGGGGHGAQSIDASNPGLKYIDPSVALLAIIIMVASSGAICRESCLILLQTIPAHLDVAELKADLFARFPTTVLNIHDMHIWCLVPGNVIVTMHVIFQSKQSYQSVLPELQSHLRSLGVSSFTIQPELLSEESVDIGRSPEESSPAIKAVEPCTCLLRCRNGQCAASKCCT